LTFATQQNRELGDVGGVVKLAGMKGFETNSSSAHPQI
jgi:hypothetical protein